MQDGDRGPRSELLTRIKGTATTVSIVTVVAVSVTVAVVTSPLWVSLAALDHYLDRRRPQRNLREEWRRVICRGCGTQHLKSEHPDNGCGFGVVENVMNS